MDVFCSLLSPRSFPRGAVGRLRGLVVIGLLAVLVLATYFSRLTSLTIRGEESRRARIAIEMIESGDWIVPRQQGEPHLSRPPLQNWTIALIGLLRGDVDAAAIRLPSVSAVLLTALLIYAYSRLFLSRFGAFAAAAAYATMGQVLELGRLGETDAMFTLLVSGSLLVWHLGRVRGWPAAATWSSAYLLAALATLTKGPQAPAYFAGSVGAYLLVTRRWREALTWSHLAGVLLFLAIWGAWQVPFYRRMGLAGARRILLGDVGLRFVDMHWLTVLKHLVTYPAEVLGSMLPWSALLVAYLHRGFRQAIGGARDHVWFLACSIAVTFPTCWLAPGARARYFMPLYPCFAPLIGLVAERSCEAARTVKWRRLWGRYLTALGLLMVAAGAVILAAATLDHRLLPIREPLWFAVLYALSAGGLAAVTLRSRHAATHRQRLAGVIAVAAFLGLTYTGIVTDSLMRNSEHAAEAVAQLKRQLPQHTRLVSFGPVHHLFAYYYREPILLLPWPRKRPPPPEVTYFCLTYSDFRPDRRPAVELPFPWEEVAVISCDRSRHTQPRNVVVVGRRLPTRASSRRTPPGSDSATAQSVLVRSIFVPVTNVTLTAGEAI